MKRNRHTEEQIITILKPKQAVKLEELLATNASLTTVYLLKDQFKTLWFAADE